jgi:hypothetical protein
VRARRAPLVGMQSPPLASRVPARFRNADAPTVLLRVQRSAGNRAAGHVVSRLLQRVSKKTEYRIGNHTFSAAELARVQHDIAMAEWGTVVPAAAPAAGPGLPHLQIAAGNWRAVWKRIREIVPEDPGDQSREDCLTVDVAGKTVTIDKGFWIKVPGARIKYEELAADLTAEQQQLATQRAGAAAVTPADSQAAMAAQIARIRAVVNGQTPAGVTATEIALACVWFGAETVRNPRSWAAGWQLLDLMETGRTYGATNKRYTWLNVITAQLAPGEAAVDGGKAPQSWRLRKGAVLVADPNDPNPQVSTPEKLQLAGSIVGGQSAQMKKGLSGYWGGKHPMAHKESEAQGKLVPGTYKAPHVGKLNIVQAKEASLLIRWLESQQVPVKADRNEQLQVIRDLIVGRVRATGLQL